MVDVTQPAGQGPAVPQPAPASDEKRGKKNPDYDDIRISVRVYTDKQRRNRFQLRVNKELTAHRDAKGVVDEIEYHLAQAAK